MFDDVWNEEYNNWRKHWVLLFIFIVNIVKHCLHYMSGGMRMKTAGTKCSACLWTDERTFGFRSQKCDIRHNWFDSTPPWSKMALSQFGCWTLPPSHIHYILRKLSAQLTPTFLCSGEYVLLLLLTFEVMYSFLFMPWPRHYASLSLATDLPLLSITITFLVSLWLWFNFNLKIKVVKDRKTTLFYVGRIVRRKNT